MDKYTTIAPKLDGQVATLWLARPEVHNALNDNMIRELTDFFTRIEGNSAIRVLSRYVAPSEVCRFKEQYKEWAGDITELVVGGVNYLVVNRDNFSWFYQDQ